METAKLSVYNYFWPYRDIIVCINLRAKRIFALSQNKYDALIKHANNLPLLQETHPHLYSVFCKLGMIVDAGIDEVQQCIYEHRLEIYAQDYYSLTIVPTLEYNFNCWYCYEEHAKGRMSEATLKAIYSYVKQVVNERKLNYFHLDWFGGEPLLCFDTAIYPLAKRIKRLMKKHNIPFSHSITTNGALITPEMAKRCKEIDLLGYQITLDGNEADHNRVKRHGSKNIYKITLQNIFTLCDTLQSDAIIQVRINFTPDNLNHLVDIINDIPEKYRQKIIFFFQQVWQTQTQDNEAVLPVKEIISTFKQAGLSALSYSLEDKMHKCYADLSSQCIITHEGKVYKCTARDFVNHPPDGILNKKGIIDWKSIYYRRLHKTSIENEHCVYCQFLPVCWGPCSQKLLEYDPNHFETICNKGGVENTVQSIMLDFLKKNSISDTIFK
jgi:uncharacterized protein